MIHNHGIAASLGHSSFWRIVGVIDVKVWNVANGDIREAASRKPHRLARQKFHVSMRSHVHHDICPKDLLDPVIGGEVLMGRRDLGIMKNTADLAIASGSGAAPLGLDAYDGVAVPDTGYHHLAPENHGGSDSVSFFSRRLAPGVANLFPGRFRQSIEP